MLPPEITNVVSPLQARSLESCLQTFAELEPEGSLSAIAVDGRVYIRSCSKSADLLIVEKNGDIFGFLHDMRVPLYVAYDQGQIYIGDQSVAPTSEEGDDSSEAESSKHTSSDIPADISLTGAPLEPCQEKVVDVMLRLFGRGQNNIAIFILPGHVVIRDCGPGRGVVIAAGSGRAYVYVERELVPVRLSADSFVEKIEKVVRQYPS